MGRIVTTGFVVAAMALTALAQDWDHDRDQRYQGDDWRPHVFDYVRTDLEHVWSAYQAKDPERVRLDKTKEELYKMQVDLDQGRFDNGILNDVIDSLRKSSNDDRLSTRDKEIIADDVVRLKAYQNEHDRWPHK
jgi:hypothetical protein